MNKLAVYEEMKDSGIPGVGVIPSDWKITRVKNLFIEINDRCANSDDYELLSVSEYYGVAKRRDKVTSDRVITNAASLDGYKICKPADLVSNIMLAWKNSMGVSDYTGIVSPAYCVYRAKVPMCQKYFHYLFRTKTYGDLFKQYSTGIINSRLRLYTEKFFAISCPMPSVAEQHNIAEYLDQKSIQIDSIITEAKASIEDYKQWKASIIYESVTKGLDPDVEMKDSGVEWIGKIPSKWDIVKITRLLDQNHPYPMGDGDHGMIKATDYIRQGIPYIRVQNLGWGTPLNLDSVVYISEVQNSAIKNSTLRPNDILFAKTGATIGKTGIVPEDIPIANTTSHVGKITVSSQYSAKFIFYVLSSYIGYHQFWEIASAKTTRPELSIEETKSLRIILPDSKKEQEVIAQYLDEQCETIDSLIVEKESLINDLEAYKKSLIYEVVTGKKKVF